ncbi:MAG: alpha-L-fucosidase [Planctomycetes bacterium]|nr:alpha-L-fucosidase [Planctomycetota bacterium]
MTRLVVLVALAGLLAGPTGGAEKPYEPTWESLAKHTPPEWFRDAKFGIYTHWGPISLATMHSERDSGWYGQKMYMPKAWEFKYHQEHFGDQKTVGYKDVIERFTAPAFDADAWADLFQRAGARFAGPVAIHHENFALWDSALTEWDSAQKGPKRDITGELARAIRARGMRFIATFHHGFTWQYFEPAYAYDAADPAYAGLYGEPHKPGTPPSKAFLDQWLAKVNEVVTKYEPDLIWHDFGLGRVVTPEYQQRMFADYYNWAAAHGRQVGVAHKHHDIHAHTGIIDFERGREDRLTPYPWLTDTAIGPWYYYKNPKYKTVDEIVDVLVDIVSKNGCMLLNVGPDGQGRIDDQARAILRGIGDWLKVNGEAIYDTRPWLVFGEGPTQQTRGGGHMEGTDKGYGPRDIRFTRSKDGRTLYVIALGRPEGDLVIRSMQVDGASADARVALLGHDGAVGHAVDAGKRLVIRVPALPPDRRPSDHAFAFRLTGFDVSLGPDARFEMPGAVTVPPEKVTLEGTKVRVQDVGGRPNIGAWDNPKERCHWLVWLQRAGEWAVRGEFTSAPGPSGLTMRLAGQTHTVAVPKTDGWFKQVWVDLGTVNVPEPGVYHLTLEPADAAAWKPVNVWNLQLAPAE